MWPDGSFRRIPVVRMILGQQHIQRWGHKQREQRSHRHAADQYQANRVTGGGARPGH
jgi:hypothetical protein